MWYEIFTFEIKYRLKRPETYLFFLFLFLFSLFGVEFVFQGIELGLVKKNSPLVIAKTMGAITGLSMVIVSMMMGIPILRDVQHDMSSLIYVNPVSKKDFLLGRFLGSFVVLIIVFSSVLWGMMLGESMPWADPQEYLPFDGLYYLQPFLWVALPVLFFGASVFFISGALSKKLMVVYTQGLILFVVFLLTKGITNESLQALLDPFSLSTLSKVSKDWTVDVRNTRLIPIFGIILYNKIFWITVALIALVLGYLKFQMIVVTDKISFNKNKQTVPHSTDRSHKILPMVMPVYYIRAQFVQLLLNAWFHSKSIMKLTSFWAPIICCYIIILVNSVSLGTVHGVNSYPATYLMMEELQELTYYFFMTVVVFYSGEIMWKEREVKLNPICDTTPLNSFVNVSSRYLGLLILYAIIMFSLIIAGVLFQTFNSFYNYELKVYFFGFFVEIFPYLALYTSVTMFFQALIRNKFLAILATISFVVINVVISTFGLEHVLLNFGGHSLAGYSDMNGYGHFLTAYLLVKMYWFLFSMLLLILTGILMENGVEAGWKKRLKRGINQISKPMAIFCMTGLSLFIGTGTYIFYNSHILNEYHTKGEENNFRGGYEKALKQFEYIPQPKIVDVQLNIELYPSKRAYDISCQYVVINTSQYPICDIHLQKRIDSKVILSDVTFDRSVTVNHNYQKYHYIIYELSQSLSPGDTLRIFFRQTLVQNGFDIHGSETDVVNNGTFFDNATLPGFGYQKKYELQDEDDRKDFGLPPRLSKAKRDDIKEWSNARTGSDSEGVNLQMIIGTDSLQTALTTGDLKRKWTKDGRNYFYYKTNQRIIHFYPVVSARYEVMKDTCIPTGNAIDAVVDLEIYYQKGHEYNLKRMMESMKMSLDYYSTHFSPYQYKHIRIVEFPRYRTFAQSLPGIIPFSEAIGFMMDIDDKKDVDMAFFITAHEVAHQWWGLQLEAANVQGQNMILETLAQYSALMVFKEKYPEAKVQQFLKLQWDEYREATLESKKEELPLVLVENESHIYYNKGALVMYKLQELIGEKNVNHALKHFLYDWRSFQNPPKQNRYATSLDFMYFVMDVTPDSLKNVVTDLFEQTNCFVEEDSFIH